MKTRVYIIALLSVMTLSLGAQNYTPSYAPSDEINWSRPYMSSGSRYVGPVYEPFDNTIPSEYNEIVAKAPSIRTFPKPGETGQSEEYPIGDAVLPMLICVLAFGGAIALRRRRSKCQWRTDEWTNG